MSQTPPPDLVQTLLARQGLDRKDSLLRLLVEQSQAATQEAASRQRARRRALRVVLAELYELRERMTRVAAALGSCECLGEDGDCECRGRDGPGSRPIDEDLFHELVGPALERVQARAHAHDKRAASRPQANDGGSDDE
ncbi:MAG: hypothetical protein KDK70_03450 [Myxococcales bacterium]|nr:hypothetical protein [Myxococcales bacterium]